MVERMQRVYAINFIHKTLTNVVCFFCGCFGVKRNFNISADLCRAENEMFPFKTSIWFYKETQCTQCTCISLSSLYQNIFTMDPKHRKLIHCIKMHTNHFHKFCIDVFRGLRFDVFKFVRIFFCLVLNVILFCFHCSKLGTFNYSLFKQAQFLFSFV